MTEEQDTGTTLTARSSGSEEEDNSLRKKVSDLEAELSLSQEENKRLYLAVDEAIRMIQHMCHNMNIRCGRCNADEQRIREIIKGDNLVSKKS